MPRDYSNVSFVNEAHLFFHRSRKSAGWIERRKDWLEYVKKFALIKHACEGQAVVENCTYWKDSRIKFLFDALNVVDAKAVALLVFQGLLATTTTLLINRVSLTSVWDSRWFQCSLGSFGVLWFLVTWLSVRPVI
jgi:hypothetical protein